MNLITCVYTSKRCSWKGIIPVTISTWCDRLIFSIQLQLHFVLRQSPKEQCWDIPAAHPHLVSWVSPLEGSILLMKSYTEYNIYHVAPLTLASSQSCRLVSAHLSLALAFSLGWSSPKRLHCCTVHLKLYEVCSAIGEKQSKWFISGWTESVPFVSKW